MGNIKASSEFRSAFLRNITVNRLYQKIGLGNGLYERRTTLYTDGTGKTQKYFWTLFIINHAVVVDGPN